MNAALQEQKKLIEISKDLEKDPLVTENVKNAANMYCTGGDTFMTSHIKEYNAFLVGYEYAIRGSIVVGIDDSIRTLTPFQKIRAALEKYADTKRWFTTKDAHEAFKLEGNIFGSDIAQKVLGEIHHEI